MDTKTTSVLKKLEETQHDFWNISHATGNFLNMLVKMVNAQNVVEVGTSNGYSGIWLAKALKETGGHLTTIEYYDKRQKLAIENFAKCGTLDIVRPLQGSACEIIEALSKDEMFDFVLIDANKSEYVKYFELIKPHLNKNALIVADNITSHPEKVQSFIDSVASDKSFRHEIINVPGGILIAYKL